MGLLRVLLAVSVLMTHADSVFGITLVNGDMAVRCFFMISGFLMALILERKYDDTRVFYVNRLLRIYPAYWAALAISMVLFAVLPSDVRDPWLRLGFMLDQSDWVGLTWATLANSSLLGIDLSWNLGIDEKVLVYPLYLTGGTDSHRVLFVPQAWTLALELQYYLLAPLIATRRTRTIIVLALASIVWARWGERAMFDAGYRFSTEGFLPSQLYFFLGGAIAYRFYDWMMRTDGRRVLMDRVSPYVLGATLAGMFIVYEVISAFDILDTRHFYMGAFLLIPFVFHGARHSKLDKAIGEYSYPIYLFHVAMFMLIRDHLPETQWGEATLVLTVALSAAYIWGVDRPIQRLRAAIAARKHETSAARTRETALTEPAK